MTSPATRRSTTTRASTLAREALAVVAMAAPLVALAAFPRLNVKLPGGIYVAIHSAIEAAVVAVCFATFAVQWYATQARTGEARGRFLGATFLGVALLETAHLLSFPGMTAFGPGSTGRGIWYWIAARLWTVLALLVSAFISTASRLWILRRRWLIAGALAAAAALVTLELASPSAASLFFTEGSGLTSLKRVLELLVMVLAACAAVVHGRLYLRNGERAAARIAAALAVTVLSEACFALYASAYDLFNLLGHVYLTLTFWLIFDALFVSALLQPYADLTAASSDLAASNAELLRLRRHVEEELAVTIDRLKETRQLQDDLVRAVTHDVRTPLQAIVLQTHRLQRTADSPETVAKSAGAIAEATRRITAMMRDLTDATQLEREGVKLSLEPVRIDDVVAGLLAASAGVIDPARIEVAMPPDLPSVDADRNRLERILANLIGNAVKYAHPGTPICVTASANASGLRIAVSDRGPGIAPEDLPRIFDRFYRGRGAPGEGLGLGLHIVRLLARAHGGDVSAATEPGVGATFTVTLPVSPGVAAGARSSSAPGCR